MASDMTMKLKADLESKFPYAKFFVQKKESTQYRATFIFDHPIVKQYQINPNKSGAFGVFRLGVGAADAAKIQAIESYVAETYQKVDERNDAKTDFFGGVKFWLSVGVDTARQIIPDALKVVPYDEVVKQFEKNGQRGDPKDMLRYAELYVI